MALTTTQRQAKARVDKAKDGKSRLYLTDRYVPDKHADEARRRMNEATKSIADEINARP